MLFLTHVYVRSGFKLTNQLSFTQKLLHFLNLISVICLKVYVKVYCCGFIGIIDFICFTYLLVCGSRIITGSDCAREITNVLYFY